MNQLSSNCLFYYFFLCLDHNSKTCPIFSFKSVYCLIIRAYCYYLVYLSINIFLTSNVEEVLSRVRMKGNVMYTPHTQEKRKLNEGVLMKFLKLFFFFFY